MNCKKCGEINGSVKKTCVSCGEILEGYTLNNLTGQYGYRHSDGTFTDSEESKPETNPEKESYYFKNCTYSYENGVVILTGERCKKYWIKDLTEKQCIHAPTQLIADRLYVKFNELGLKDITGNSYLEVDHWYWFYKYTVYYPSDGSMASVDYAEMENDEILTIDQLKDFDEY